MKKIITLFALLCFVAIAHAQKTDSTDNKIIRLRCCATSDPAKAPLWVVNGFKVKQSEVAAINLAYLLNLRVFTSSEAVAKYGDAAKNGVIEITLKKDIKAIPIRKILAKNRLSSQSSLPVYYNNQVKILSGQIFGYAPRNFKIIVIEANSNAVERTPFNGKYLSISETIAK